LYDLVELLDKKWREHARQVVSDFYEKLYGKKLGHFPRLEEPGTREKAESSVMRYAAPKTALEKPFAVPMRGRGSGERFALRAVELVMKSPVLPYDGLTLESSELEPSKEP
jgi:hypothetical protein